MYFFTSFRLVWSIFKNNKPICLKIFKYSPILKRSKQFCPDGILRLKFCVQDFQNLSKRLVVVTVTLKRSFCSKYLTKVREYRILRSSNKLLSLYLEPGSWPKHTENEKMLYCNVILKLFTSRQQLLTWFVHYHYAFYENLSRKCRIRTLRSYL